MVSLNKALLNPYDWRGTLRGGWLTSHDNMSYKLVHHTPQQPLGSIPIHIPGEWKVKVKQNCDPRKSPKKVVRILLITVTGRGPGPRKTKSPELKINLNTRWARTSHKWSYCIYNYIYKWPYKWWVTEVVTLISGVITLLKTGRDHITDLPPFMCFRQKNSHNLRHKSFGILLLRPKWLQQLGTHKDFPLQMVTMNGRFFVCDPTYRSLMFTKFQANRLLVLLKPMQNAGTVLAIDYRLRHNWHHFLKDWKHQKMTFHNLLFGGSRIISHASCATSILLNEKFRAWLPYVTYPNFMHFKGLWSLKITHQLWFPSKNGSHFMIPESVSNMFFMCFLVEILTISGNLNFSGFSSAKRPLIASRTLKVQMFVAISEKIVFVGNKFRVKISTKFTYTV